MNVGGVLEGIVINENKKSKASKGEEVIDFGALLGQLMIGSNETMDKASDLVNSEVLSLEDLNFNNMSAKMESVIKEFFDTTKSSEIFKDSQTSDILNSLGNMSLEEVDDLSTISMKDSINLKPLENPEELMKALNDLAKNNWDKTNIDNTVKNISKLHINEELPIEVKDMAEAIKEVSFKTTRDDKEISINLDNSKQLDKVSNKENLVSLETENNITEKTMDTSLSISNKNIELKDVEKSQSKELNHDEDIDFKEILAKNDKNLVSNINENIQRIPDEKNIVKINNAQTINDSITSEIIDLKEGEKSTLKVVLSPKELGEVEIKLELKNGVIKGNILVENSDIRHQLQKQIDGLRLELKSKNINIENLDVNVSHDSFGQDNPRNFNRKQHSNNFYRFKESNKFDDGENSSLGLRGYSNLMKGNSSLNLYV